MLAKKLSQISSYYELNYVDSYIIAMVCHVLGYSEQCYVLTVIRNFCNQTIQKKTEYFFILSQYSTIDSIIAKYIESEYQKTQNKDMWTRLYQLYLSQIANLITIQRYEDALFKYQKMINILKNYFGIKDININSTSYQKNDNLLQDSKQLTLV